MIEWQIYWKKWWRRPLWEEHHDPDEHLGIWRHSWIMSIGPLQIRKIWYSGDPAK